MSATDPGLREELLRMAAADQEARQRLDDRGAEPEPRTLKRVRAVDAANTARMKAIVAARGWPGRSLVGEDGALAAWLLVQHADHDPAFQRACLELLGQAGEADPRQHAYLTDRVLLAEGRPQRYGTQFMLAGGSWRPRPLADPEQVDERRRQVGLKPLDDYRRLFAPPDLSGGRDSMREPRASGRREEQDVAERQTTMPEMRLELVPVPVSDVDRAKAFYEQAGFELGVDTRMSDTMRVVQFTPPGSACTIVFGTGMPGISDMTPGSVHGLHLVVDDIDEARAALLERGVQVDEVIDFSQVKYAGFRDPDGNTWLLQEFPSELRQPGQSFYRERR